MRAGARGGAVENPAASNENAHSNTVFVDGSIGYLVEEGTTVTRMNARRCDLWHPAAEVNPTAVRRNRAMCLRGSLSSRRHVRREHGVEIFSHPCAGGSLAIKR